MASLPVPNDVTTPLCCVALALMLSCVVQKRARDDGDEGDVAKRRRNDDNRGERRKHVVAQVLALDSTNFRKMFRMDKRSLLLLHSKISPFLDKGITPRNIRMAEVNSFFFFYFLFFL